MSKVADKYQKLERVGKVGSLHSLFLFSSLLFFQTVEVEITQ